MEERLKIFTFDSQVKQMVVKFPCSICKNSVNKNHKALQCDICDSWVHIGCNHITSAQYSAIQKENADETIPVHKRQVFYCNVCLNENIAFGKTDDNIFSTTNSLGLNLESEIVDFSVTIDKSTQQQINHITKLIKESNSTQTTPSFCNYYSPSKMKKTLSKTQSSFKILHLNIASLQYHFTDLEQ